MLNIAYIGNGKSANRYHIPFSRRVNEIRISKIFSPVETPWQKIPDVVYVSDLDSILNDSKIQVVVICTPPQTHYDLATRALQHGKNVVLEKPFTSSVAEAKALFALAHKQGVLLEAYQNRRFDGDFLTVQKVIKSGKLGNVYEVEDNFDYYRPQQSEQVTKYDRFSTFLYGHACHTVDQVISFWGAPKNVHYDVRQLLGKNHMSDYFDLDLYYPNQLKVEVKSSYFRLNYRPSFVVYGTKGRFIHELPDIQEKQLKEFYMPIAEHPDFGVETPDRWGKLSYISKDGTYHEEKVPTEKGNYSLYYEGLVDTLEHGAKPIVSEDETLALMTVLENGAKEQEGQL
ncbi:Gfo/Idh/MocA family oxidoreductase [Lacticaseibacillus hegangensis]|uniref:Gfo/Idh/MocA family oxidoreductase n=1 Tax=Lacticaseibacillus hegangensis TaxID=2486010 RepID=A0ABW4D1P2_9LACO|nr:Gfo/Idh/MocA family oxidoreductase [Lacticaseibacillus hegangensis]